MHNDDDQQERSVEARLSDLEAAVARLSTVLEPELAVRAIATPVAAAVLKEAFQHNFAAKFFTLLDLGETVIKYAAAITFACASEAGGGERTAVFKLFNPSPSLGTLADGLRKIIDGPLAETWPVNAIRQTLRRANGKPTSTSRYLLDEFIRLRNTDKGHGAYQSEGYYEDLYKRNYTTVQDCVSASMYLHTQLLFIDGARGTEAGYGYGAIRLMGATPVRLRETLISANRLYTGSTYLWDQSNKFLLLDPFVTYIYCSECGQEHLFFAERITEDRISYHSSSANHRIDIARSRR